MSLIGDLREIADLVKKAGNIELYRRILDLQGEVVELSSRKLELERESQELKATLGVKQKMTFKEPFYYQEADEVPFCANCWESGGQAIHLVCDEDAPFNRCKKCGAIYRRPGEGSSGGQAAFRRRPHRRP